MNAEVLFVDGDWLVLAKPPGIATTPSGNRGSLVDIARAAAPGAAMHHPLSRLDTGVSGAVLFAVSRRAAATAAHAKERGEYRRWYVAIVAGVLEGHGAWSWAIGIDPRRPSQRLADSGADLRPAETAWTSLGTSSTASMLECVPRTGRTHQIRVHAARAGHPLLGDRAYGGAARVTTARGDVVGVARVMLHAAAVQIPGTATLVRAPIPSDFATVLRSLLPDLRDPPRLPHDAPG